MRKNHGDVESSRSKVRVFDIIQFFYRNFFRILKVMEWIFFYFFFFQKYFVFQIFDIRFFWRIPRDTFDENEKREMD